jgi:hypothetical protein
MPITGTRWLHAIVVALATVVSLAGMSLAAFTPAVAAVPNGLAVPGAPAARPSTTPRRLQTEGLSIDMSTTWTARRITIVNTAGHRVTIHSTPHNGLNKTLIAVGATYRVIHFLDAARAMDVWSVNGH